jgi:hypothetical protein
MLFSGWKFWLFLIIVIWIVAWVANNRQTPLATDNEAPPPYEPEPAPILAVDVRPLDDIRPREDYILPPEDYIQEDIPPPPIRPRVIAPIADGAKSVGERLTCAALGELLDGAEILNNIRPKFLTNPQTGRRLEIDCWSEDYGIGVEYNGIQHYSYPTPFNMTEQQFIAQNERDLLKRELADANGTPIITVPCTVDAYRFDDRTNRYIPVRRTQAERYELIRQHLRRELEMLNVI